MLSNITIKIMVYVLNEFFSWFEVCVNVCPLFIMTLLPSESVSHFELFTLVIVFCKSIDRLVLL